MSQLGDRPAFPVPASATAKGVSVRDWFAGMALQGVVAKGLDVIGDRVVSDSERNLMIARRAYALADAMIIVVETEMTAAATAAATPAAPGAPIAPSATGTTVTPPVASR